MTIDVDKNPENITSDFIKTKDNNQRKKLYQISFLRAVASTGVCLFHLGFGNSNFLEKNETAFQIFKYGYLGVPVFFIISAFIICYSLPENYQIINFYSFLKKRLTRVEPPYLISILLTLVVAYLASFITHNPVAVSWKNVFYHIGYLNNFTTNVYINSVYWTLGIEFQFYILIGLLFNWMNKSVYFLILIIISLLALNAVKIEHTSLIFEHTPLFCVGILMYFINYSNTYPKLILILLIVISLVVISFGKLEVLYVSLFTIGVILVPFRNNKIVSFLSDISYSLYLVHIPIGGRVINLSLRFVHTESQKYLTVAAAFIISIIAAYIFYILIEKPSIKWSKQLYYPATC